MMIIDEQIDWCEYNQSTTPAPSSNIAGKAKIMVAKGAM